MPYRVPVTWTSRVKDSIDDVEQVSATGEIYIDSSDLELVDDSDFSGMQSAVGIRFRDVPIEPGTIISSAVLTFTVDEVDTGPTFLRIFGEAADDAAEFTMADYSLTTRTWTQASVDWSPQAWETVGDTQSSPDLSEILQAVVDRDGWGMNHSIAFFFNGTGERTTESFDGGGPDNAPKLTVC